MQSSTPASSRSPVAEKTLEGKILGDDLKVNGSSEQAGACSYIVFDLYLGHASTPPLDPLGLRVSDHPFILGSTSARQDPHACRDHRRVLAQRAGSDSRGDVGCAS